ncbi:MAG: hypothetical protein H6737_12575 [Alphaproteobacteria bacterium]|nr:hypothetical protein [Alphaproteobacteria bacterium]
MILLVASALADCSDSVSDDALDGLLVDALSAYEALQAERFVTLVTEIEASVPCLSTPLPRHLAAGVHRARGLKAFVGRDHDSAAASFAAARAIEPAYAFPTSLVPEDNPVLEDYTAIDPATRAARPTEPPESGTIRVDGSRGHRLEGLPALVQWIGDDGAVQNTWLVDGDAPDPRYPRVGHAETPEPKVPRSARLHVGAGAMYLDARNRSTRPGMGSIDVLATLPLGPVDFEVGGLVGITRDDIDASAAVDTRFLVTPALRAGLRVPLATGAVEPWVGGCALVTFHGSPDAPPVGPGGAGTAGLFVPLGGPVGLGVEALAGFSEGLLVQGGLDVGLGL